MDTLDRLCIHSVTTKPWPVEMAIDRFAAAGVRGITVWREALEGRDLAEVRRRIVDAGLSLVSLCRGGFFPAVEPASRQAAIDDNRRCLDEAAALGAPLVVLVCGADPEVPLQTARTQIAEGIATLLPHAESMGVRLGVEPLHPMYADTRSAINTLGQANDLCAELNHPLVGVALDMYHTWWDPHLESEIARCGQMEKLFAFHVCDWRVPTEHLLLDRELMGEGCIPMRQIHTWVEATGFDGFVEVEIFSEKRWAEDQDAYLSAIIKSYRANF
ncbi:MAG: sugar phosphate isomerase/epimerase family protein [Opitutales bacterium]